MHLLFASSCIFSGQHKHAQLARLGGSKHARLVGFTVSSQQARSTGASEVAFASMAAAQAQPNTCRTCRCARRPPRCFQQGFQR